MVSVFCSTNDWKTCEEHCIIASLLEMLYFCPVATLYNSTDVILCMYICMCVCMY